MFTNGDQMPHFSLTRKAIAVAATATASGLMVGAAPAHAATAPAEAAVVAPGQVAFTAADGQVNKLVLTAAGSRVTFDDVVPVAAGDGCTADPAHTTRVVCDLGGAPAARAILALVY